MAAKKSTISRASNKCLATQYAEDVVAGKIIACRKVILACERHLRDLERGKSDDYPWVFDEELGYRPIAFMERFCKPSQGNFNRIVLLPWQHFVIGSLYGWVDKQTKLRRYKSGLIRVGRKNGKSTMVSGLSLFGCSKDGEHGARVYQLANSMKQARVVFDECQAMVKSSPDLKKHFRVLRDAIYFDATQSKIEPQASDSEKLDGLNCHLGVFDEIHEYKTYKLINVIKNSTGARRQPLIIYITTAGYQLDGPLMDFDERAADVLEGVIDDDRSFYYIAELDESDDLDDPSCWIKANPSLGTTIKLEDMIQEWGQRKGTPQERTDFITKRLNTFVQADEETFLTWDIIKRNKDHINLEDLQGRECIGGFDLSNTEDFTSACLEFPLDDGRVFILSHSFVPETKVKLDNEKLPFREWQSEGLLTICPGDYVTKETVYDWFVEQAQRYSIRLITYDPAHAFRLVQDLIAYGGEDWIKVVRQGALTLSPALKDIKEMFLAGRVVFNENPLFRWYLNNVKLVTDRNGNWLPTKQDRYRKIDGFAAFLNSHTEVMPIMNQITGDGGGVGFISVKDLMRE